MCKGLSQLPATCLKGAKDIKHKISHLLQKPEPHSAEPKQNKDKSTAGKRSPTAAEVEKWKESFSNLINSDVGRVVFASFLRSEFSEENLKFWEACEEFKKSPVSQLQSRAANIYQQFIRADAVYEVNLEAAIRELTKENVEQACPTCFDEAQRRIYLLMEKDSYRRFLHCPLLQELSHTAPSGGEGQGTVARGA